jgi:flagellar protein FliS
LSAADAYLENQILTATPQKLRLLLIHGAIRFANTALKQWEDGRLEEASEAIIRCRAIVTELFSVVRPEGFSPAEQTVSVYVFLFQELTLAQMDRTPERVRGVLRVLNEERETWTRLCEQLPEAPASPRASQPQEITMSNFVAGTVPAPFPPATTEPRQAFILDA